MRIAVDLNGAGTHPAASRHPGQGAGDPLNARSWAALTAQLERTGVDLVTIGDTVALPDGQHGQYGQYGQEGQEGRPDHLHAVTLAAFVAARTTSIGILPVAATAWVEPFHVSKAIATLDHISLGRAGWLVETGAEHTGLYGDGTVYARDEPPRSSAADYWAEAAEFVTAARLLWDTWEDDAEIRDADTDRFLDAERVHQADFRGRWFSVRGPSTCPRPPQGRPPIAVAVRDAASRDWASRYADIAFTETSEAPIEPAVCFTDLAVALAREPGAAAARVRELDGTAAGRAWSPGTDRFTGTPGELVDLLTGRDSDVRLRPAQSAVDLPLLVAEVLPELRAAGAEPAASLRARLGLSRPANHFISL